MQQVAVPFSNDPVGFAVRHYKGSLTLNQLSEIPGDGKLFQACREFFETYKTKSATTAGFRNFWEQKLRPQKMTLDAWFDSKGGLPVP